MLGLPWLAKVTQRIARRCSAKLHEDRPIHRAFSSRIEFTGILPGEKLYD